MKKSKENKALHECQYKASVKAVNMFFRDIVKAEIWMNAENYLLGGITPRDMIQIGRFDKLIDLIYTQIEENKQG